MNERKRYPEFAQLQLDRPSTYLCNWNGHDLAQIVEARDDIKSLQLSFIAHQHECVIAVIVGHEGGANHRVIGTWGNIHPQPVYFTNLQTHLWLLHTDGQNKRVIRQKAIEKIIDPLEKENQFRIFIESESEIFELPGGWDLLSPPSDTE